MKTPSRNQDLRHIQTELSEMERAAAIQESKRLKSIRDLGNRYLLHPDYNGHYKPELHERKPH